MVDGFWSVLEHCPSRCRVKQILVRVAKNFEMAVTRTMPSSPNQMQVEVEPSLLFAEPHRVDAV